jgi:hypothetical protein
MFVVKVCNNSGKFKEWDVFLFSDQAQRERDLLIAEHDFWPDDVIVEKVNC